MTANRVVLLGGGGYIGHNLCSHLQAVGIEPVTVSSAECDLRSAEATQSLLSSLPAGATLICCAVVDRAVDSSANALLENLRLARSIASCAPRCAPSAVIYLSSVDVYGVAPAVPITEQTEPAPVSPYGYAKYCSELMLARQLDPICPLAVLRLPGVYGGENDRKSLLHRLLSRLLQGRQVTIHGDGSTCRDYLHVHDLCRVVSGFVGRPYAGVLNVASGTSVSILRIVALLAEAAGIEAELQHVPTPAGTTGDLVFDVTALRRTLPKIRVRPLHEAVRSYVETAMA